MKKLVLSIAVIATIIFTACGSDDDGGKSCSTKLTEVGEAAQAYGLDTSVENCNAYKDALQASLGCYEDQTAEEVVQQTVDSLICE